MNDQNTILEIKKTIIILNKEKTFEQGEFLNNFAKLIQLLEDLSHETIGVIDDLFNIIVQNKVALVKMVVFNAIVALKQKKRFRILSS